ncbi:hypothetical protein ABZ770_22620 [Streptomyces sp. NPDC006654]|uniref:hypothetical protein n=1 Tax=Streptomyces sp. NPDC006654 TaxID=3156897 RepID=UPI003408E820
MPDINETRALLEDPDAFGTFGRFTETPVGQMPPEMRAAFDFTKSLRGLVPGPHKIWAANPALLTKIAPNGAYYQADSTLSKAEIEIATLVICGRWGAAYSSFEHEKIGVRLGGLDAAKAEALIAGLPTAFADPRQQSRPSTTATTSASTRTPASSTSLGTAPTPSTACRWRPATAARCATCSASRSTRSSSARRAPAGDASPAMRAARCT